MEDQEEQNQLTILSPNSIRIDENLQHEDEDRISLLPDCLILHIFSLLPETKDAIRTGALSKRWRSLWTLTPNLVFKHSIYEQSPSDFVSSVNKTLTQCPHFKLHKLEIYMKRDRIFEAEVNSWIGYAVSRNVEELKLDVPNLYEVDSYMFELCVNFEFCVDPCFTDLRLRGFAFDPPVAVSWKRLRSLCISYTYLDEELIENILLGSPVLETLVLEACYGYKQLEITSKSVKNLVFSRYDNPYSAFGLSDIIEINAPNIVSLKIQYDLQLWKLLLLDLSALVEANLDYIPCGHIETTTEEAEEEFFKGFIQSLFHVKELKVGPMCHQVVTRLEAKGFVFPPNMKFLEATPASYFDSDFFDEEDNSDSDFLDEEDNCDSDSDENGDG